MADVSQFAAFCEVVLQAFEVPAMRDEFDRLSGSNLSARGAPLDRMIDKATGRQDAEFRAFTEFVHEVLWCRALGNEPLPGIPRWSEDDGT